VVVNYLRRKLKDKERSILRCDFLHIRCCAHNLNLLVQDGLKDLSKPIVKAQNVMRYVKYSLARFEKLKSCAEKEFQLI
jgi:hypothetical protein